MELILGGRYLPESVLGQGGFGTAFLARDFDSPTKRRCVVKLFQPPVTLTPTQMETALRLFATEAEVLERLGLQHPQIPNLYAYFPLLITNPLTNRTEELFYLVQEFVDGEDLEKVLDREGKFSQGEVEDVLQAMLGVLDFVHSKGAIHRDVKPSNIMKGRDGRLSLLDFGAVKEVTAPSGSQRGPTTISSPDYAPPEQIMNGTVDATSDLYALAATCVILLTNKGSHELRDSSINTWRWEPYAQVSLGLAQVLNKMLQARPSDRYPSAKAVLAVIAASSGQSTNSGQSINSGQSAVNLPTSSQTAPSTGNSPDPQPISPPPAPTPLPPQRVSPVVASAPSQPLSLMRLLTNAAFTGTQGGLLAIATLSVLGTTLFGGGIWLAMVAVLLLLQVRRTIEGWDLLIIAGLTLAAVLLFWPLNQILGGETALIFVVAVMAGGIAVAIAVLFRLIFRLVSNIL